MLAYLGQYRFWEQNGRQGVQPDIPDLLAEYYRYKRFDWRHLPWPGAMSDQPWQFMYELDCVEQALEQQAQIDQAAAAAKQALEEALKLYGK